jgi:predicted O-linked N-acetylglucosamine transferase (SPINDLY family)
LENQHSKILTLIKSGKFETALNELSDIDSKYVWKDSLTLRCLRILKRNEDALSLAEKLLLNKTEDTEQLRFIGIVLSEQNKLIEACRIFKRICSQNPENAELHLEYGIMLSTALKLDQAELHFKKALNIQPNNANAHSQLARIYCRTGRVKDGLDSYYRVALLEPQKAQHIQRIVYWSNYHEQTTQQSNFHMARLWAKRAHPESQTGSNTWRDANPDKPLKIGFVSADFCAHAVSFFIIPLLENIDKNLFQIFAYSDVKKPDHLTEEIKSHCDVWHDSSRQSDTDLGAQIGANQLDVLIDLGGHTANNRMGIFSQNIAPIQISWLGYPSTTGLNSVNYRITDHIADPITEDEHYSEELIRLDSGFLCFKPLKNSPKIIFNNKKILRSKNKSKNNEITRFGSFNNLAKISPLTLDAWSAALHRVPNSTLYLKRQQLINDSARENIINEFSKRGISEDRLILKTSKAKIEQHLAEYNNIDIALDTSPYNGTTTTLESLWMGTPVISLKGQTHASRVSASILHRVVLDDLVAVSIDDFANIAEELSKNKKRLYDISENMRQTMKTSSLLNSALFAKGFEQSIRGKWHLWCAERNKEHGIETQEKIIGNSEDFSARI